jgi:hypothetical protein
VTAATVIALTAVIASAWMFQSCAGEPADLKCSLVPCRTEPPMTLTANQRQAWHDCMNQRREEYPIALGPVGLTTTTKEQRDYDDCVSQVRAVRSAAPSPNTVHP